MSGAVREKDQADFDLERFIDMFDEALTSQDPRVTETLRSLLMIVALTRPETHSRPDIDRQTGPLRRMAEDVRQAHRRIGDLEETVNTFIHKETEKASWYLQEEKYKMALKAHMAQQIDQDVINQLKARARGIYEK